MTRLLLAAALSLGSVVPTLGQETRPQAVFPESNDKVLAGVKAVDARFLVVTWLEMKEDIDRIRTNVQSAFELGLRRDGLIVDSSAPNFLYCRASFALAGGLVAYAYSVEYFDFQMEGVHRLLWRDSGIVTIGRSNFSPDDVAKTCSDAFANAWLKWNPRRSSQP